MVRLIVPFLSILLFWGGLAHAAEDTDYTEAVVVSSSVTMYGSAEDNSLPKINLFQGAAVRVVGKKGERYFVHYDKGKDRYEGWVDKKALKLGRSVSSVKTEVYIPPEQIYPGVVVEDQSPVYEDQSTMSREIGRLHVNEPVEIITQTSNWFKIRINLDNGTSMLAWVEKPKVKLLSKKNVGKPTATVGGEKEPPTVQKSKGSTVSEVQADRRARNDVNLLSGARLFLAPVFDIRHYEATQLRLGVGVDYPLSPDFSVGVPISLTVFDAFSSVQGGIDLSYNLGSISMFQFYSRLGLLFDYFWSGGKSLQAATADLGLGLQCRLADRWAVYIEPGVEYSYWVSSRAPTNWVLRGQMIMGGRYLW
jgi:hypothetical protein